MAQDFPEGEPRQIKISGKPDAVERAVKMVQELIQGEPGSAQAIIQKVCALSRKEFLAVQGSRAARQRMRAAYNSTG